MLWIFIHDFRYKKYRISNELSFITKFITWVGKHDIMRGSAEHIIFANEFEILFITIGISIFQL